MPLVTLVSLEKPEEEVRRGNEEIHELLRGKITDEILW
jgi:hypothetical protein